MSNTDPWIEAAARWTRISCMELDRVGEPHSHMTYCNARHPACARVNHSEDTQGDLAVDLRLAGPEWPAVSRRCYRSDGWTLVSHNGRMDGWILARPSLCQHEAHHGGAPGGLSSCLQEIAENLIGPGVLHPTTGSGRLVQSQSLPTNQLTTRVSPRR